MTLDIQIDYPGTCEEAFRLYEQCLGGRITLMLTYGASPAAARHPELADKIVHATLILGEISLAGVDVPLAQYKPPQGFTLLLNMDEEEDARRIFAALAEDGNVRLPLQPTFWSKLYAVLTDRFGTPWKINCTALTTMNEPRRK